MNVIVYTKPDCVQCTQTTKYLDKLGVEYTATPIDDYAMSVAQLSGFTSAPLVRVAEDDQSSAKWWAGFRPDQIKALAS